MVGRALLAAADCRRTRRRTRVPARRPGTPERSAPVIQTQIILAIVGGVVMLIVGSNLARAFGIVGVASLIRYRAKIDDPKDAVVMLATLSVGLASGVELYGPGRLLDPCLFSRCCRGRIAGAGTPQDV